MASGDLEERLESFSDLTNIENAFSSGKVQLEFELDEDRAGRGLTTEMVASQVRGAFYGAEALREQRGRHEVRVMVHIPRIIVRASGTSSASCCAHLRGRMCLSGRLPPSSEAGADGDRP